MSSSTFAHIGELTRRILRVQMGMLLWWLFCLLVSFFSLLNIRWWNANKISFHHWNLGWISVFSYQMAAFSWGLPRWHKWWRLCLPVQGMQETRFRSLGWKDHLGKEMTTHSRFLAWKIPWTEEPGGLQSMRLQTVGHDWVHIHTHTLYLAFHLQRYVFLQY